jgi:hypothetical protein
MRVVVGFFDGHPELLAVMSALPPRARAERMRMLASIGLSVINNRSVGIPLTQNERSEFRASEAQRPNTGVPVLSQTDGTQQKKTDSIPQKIGALARSVFNQV